MAKWTNANIQDGGSDLIRTRAALAAGRVKMHVIKAYTAGDSYATVTGNSCGAFDMVAGDFVQSGGAGAARVTTIAAKTIALTANSGVAPNNHIAVVDSVSSEVLLVTDETNDQQLFSGNTFAAPAWVYNVGQPT
jgi:hypothetical protein